MQEANLSVFSWDHKEAEIAWYGSRSYVDQRYSSVYQNMFQIVDAKCHG